MKKPRYEFRISRLVYQNGANESVINKETVDCRRDGYAMEELLREDHTVVLVRCIDLVSGSALTLVRQGQKLHSFSEHKALPTDNY